MFKTNVLVGVYLVFTSLCSLFEVTNSRTSTMWKLNTETGKIEKRDLMGEQMNSYSALEDIVYNYNAMAEVYLRDETFFTIVSTTPVPGYRRWIRQPRDNSWESLLQSKTLKTDTRQTANNKKSTLKGNTNAESKTYLKNNLDNVENLDCGHPINYTNYDYLINLSNLYEHKQAPIIPEPEVIHFFLQSEDKEHYKEFNVDSLEKRLMHFKKQNAPSAELFHHIGNYWRIIGEPVQAIKCFRRSLDILPSASEVMYDLAKVLYNLQYLDDAINMARRSIEFQGPPFSAWRQYLLLGDIMKTYGDTRSSVLYYHLALELNPTQEIIIRSLNEAERKPTENLHAYTVVIIFILVIMVLIVILTSMITEAKTDRYSNGHIANNSETYSGKPQRHFNRGVAMRSLKGLATTPRVTRQRK